MLEEKRRAPRFKIDQMIELSFGKESYVQATGIDISESGLLCESSEHVEPSTQLYLMIRLPINDKNYEITSEAVVVRSVKQNNGFSIGIKFTGMQEEDKKKLSAFMAGIGPEGPAGT
jgi:hypothetical protein